LNCIYENDEDHREKLEIYMADLTSRDDEKAREKELKAEQDRQQDEQKAREQATEKGRKEEQDLQKERELATEKGRKQGLEQERARQKAKGGSVTWIIIALVVIVIVFAAIAWFSLSETVTSVTPGTPLPFTTNYAVSFPEGQTTTLGNSRINVIWFENELITDIDGAKQKLVVGDERNISERRGIMKALGVFTIMDTNYAINLKYKGERDGRAYFDMAVQTSKQVPDILLKRMLPPEIEARSP
jgi:hypothetical protein